MPFNGPLPAGQTFPPVFDPVIGQWITDWKTQIPATGTPGGFGTGTPSQATQQAAELAAANNYFNGVYVGPTGGVDPMTGLPTSGDSGSQTATGGTCYGTDPITGANTAPVPCNDPGANSNTPTQASKGVLDDLLTKLGSFASRGALIAIGLILLLGAMYLFANNK